MIKDFDLVNDFYNLLMGRIVARYYDNIIRIVFRKKVLNTRRQALQVTAGEQLGIVLVDEAYAEFAHDRSQTALSLLDRYPRLLVSRTMSKAFAFAGIRVGYLAAHPAVVDALRLVRLPYHLSAITQAAAVAALRHSDEMLSRVDELRTQRDRIVDELTAMGFEPYPSDANFVLVGGVADPQATFRALLDRGILVRDVGLPHTLRITAGTRAETSALLAAMAELGAE